MIMYVIAVYDVDAKRDNKMLKLFRKYLFHVQGSVFEGELTFTKLKNLESETKAVIDDESEDTVLFYRILSPKEIKKDFVGKDKKIEPIVL